MLETIILIILVLLTPANAEDTLIKTSPSPDNAYVIRAYVGDGGGGATTANHVRCNLENVREHSFKDIYYRCRQDDVDISWLNSTTVNISGKVLDITKETYDSRDDEDDFDFWQDYPEAD